MTELLILKHVHCVPCPDRYGNLVCVDDWCNGCEFYNTFKSTNDTVVCEYNESD